MRGTLIAVALLALVAALAWALPVLPGIHGIAGYLPLHMLLETVAIVVAMLVFAVGWNAHSDRIPGNMVWLSCAFLGVGLLDFAHMLSYTGMPDFVTPGGPEKAINFWLLERSLATVALLAAVLMPPRPFASAATRYKLLAAVIGATAFAYWLFLYHQDALPHNFVPGQGLTAFKIVSEYAIIALNLAAAWVLWARRGAPQTFNVAALFGAACTMALGEFFFTLYASVTDVYNLLGHVYVVIAYLFFYRAIFVAAIETPYRQLRVSQNQLQATIDAIPDSLFELGLDGRYHDLHTPRRDLLAASIENLQDKTVDEVLPHEAASVVMSALREAWDDGHSYGKVIELPLAQGNRWFELSVSRKNAGKSDGPRFIVLSRDITERRQMEGALRRSEAMLHTLYDSTSDAVMLLDENGFIDCNKATLRMFGCATQEEFCALHPADLSPPEQPCGVDSMTLANERIAAAMAKGNNIFEWIHRRVNTGSDFSAEVLLSRMELDGRTILQATVRDITERKHAEELAHQFGSLLQGSFDEIYMFDAHSLHFLLASKGAEENLGYSSEELNQLTPLDIKPMFTVQSFEQLVAPLRGGDGKSLFFETIHRRKDGTTYPVEAHLQLMRGRTPVFMAIIQDLSKRKNSEARIELLSRTYRLLSRVNEAIVRAPNRSLLFEAVCNAAMTSELFRFIWIGMLDKSEHRVIPMARSGAEQGYTPEFNIRIDDESCREWPIVKAIREGVHVVRQDIGNETDCEQWQDEAAMRGYRSAGMFPIRETGVVTGTINVYSADEHFFTQDIIELMLELAADVSFALDVFAEKKRRGQAEAEIRQLNIHLERRVAERTHQLELVNKELEAFCYSVSHDLRAPLRSIDGFSQVLLKKYQGQLDATGKDYLNRVRRSSQHMGQLIDDMLQLSQVTRGPLKRDRVDLSAIAEQVVEELCKAQPGRQVRFILQQGMAVHGDAGLLRIAMDNLLGNAWKYSGKKAAAEIEFGAQNRPSDHGEERAFFVRDNGAGFNMDYAQKLFGAFQRLHGASEFEGTGIGLATVQRIIHRHHGKVWAEGKEEHGATFYFTLPQRERESEEAA
ncbi:MAG: MASE3 domain-containing protein [Gallionella sp.]|nr:MASE3 domain-containing protein [Gallionella sp.]